MPSDPLPLNPEPATEAGRELDLRGTTGLTHIIAIEQEARTLARAEVIADIEAAMLAIEAALPEGVTPGYRLGHMAAVDRVLTALSRLGERE